jgi:hypothetical protein
LPISSAISLQPWHPLIGQITYAASSVAATTSLVLHPRNCKPQNPIIEVVVGLTDASTIKTTLVPKLLYPTGISLKERIQGSTDSWNFELAVEGKVQPVN